jgi:acetaldehyde dehydrogenase
MVPVSYAEIVSTVASASAGPGTRQNIDEFTFTTARALESVGGADRGKAIIILNPADPPIMMRNTIYMVIAEGCDEKGISSSIECTVKAVADYVPGYRIKGRPAFDSGGDGKRVITVLLEVEGAGDFLPTYAGNLDIMTSSAWRVGQEVAAKVLRRTGVES